MGEEVGGRCDKHNRTCRFTGICLGEATLRFISRGISVFPPGGRGSHLHLVHEGILGIFRLWETGKEAIASLWLPGDIFGLTAGMEDRGPRPRPGLMVYDVRAVVPSALCVSYPDTFFSHVGQEPSRVAQVLRMCGRQSMETFRIVARPVRQGPEKALAHTLAVLAERVGVVVPNGTLIPYHLPHKDLADMAGMTRSTATRAVHCLCFRGLIRMEKRRILVPSVVELWEMIEEECP